MLLWVLHLAALLLVVIAEQKGESVYRHWASLTQKQRQAAWMVARHRLSSGRKRLFHRAKKLLRQLAAALCPRGDTTGCFETPP